jgi:hypothetical protein
VSKSKKTNQNRLVSAIGIAVIAIVLIFTGLNHQHEPTCNNTTMKPGDLCILSTGGAVSYEQRKNDSGRTGMIQLGLAGVGIIVSATLFGLYLRDRRRAGSVPPTTNE